jgi:hypothetical protein
LNLPSFPFSRRTSGFSRTNSVIRSCRLNYPDFHIPCGLSVDSHVEKQGGSHRGGSFIRLPNFWAPYRVADSAIHPAQSGHTGLRDRHFPYEAFLSIVAVRTVCAFIPGRSSLWEFTLSKSPRNAFRAYFSWLISRVVRIPNLRNSGTGGHQP